MKKFLLFLLLGYFSNVNAQNTYQWADSAAVWHITYNGLTGLGYQKMNYQKDTIINNHACQKIVRESQSLLQVSQGVFAPTPISNDPSYFLYKSNDTVYTYHNGNFSMGFKTNASVGEVWDLGNFSDPASNVHAYVKVDSVYYQNYNGQSLRNIKIHNCDANGDSLDFANSGNDTIPVAGISSPFFGGNINEKFGPMLGFNVLNYTSLYFMVDEFIPSQTLCYQSATFPFIQFSASDCFNNIFVGVEELINNKLQLYPNPVHNQLTINNKAGETILISDVYGKIILQKQLNVPSETIDISEFANGMYLVNVGNMKSKIIKN